MQDLFFYRFAKTNKTACNLFDNDYHYVNYFTQEASDD